MYPVSAHELKEYLAYYLNLPKNQLVVKKPGEPSEEYQDEMKNKPSEFKSKLQDIEYGDAPKVEADKIYGDKANASLLKELLKARKEITHAEEDAKNKAQKKLQDREEKGTASPLSKSTNPHPDPKRKK
jgi:hypothetical protein